MPSLSPTMTPASSPLSPLSPLSPPGSSKPGGTNASRPGRKFCSTRVVSRVPKSPITPQPQSDGAAPQAPGVRLRGPLRPAPLPPRRAVRALRSPRGSAVRTPTRPSRPAPGLRSRRRRRRSSGCRALAAGPARRPRPRRRSLPALPAPPAMSGGRRRPRSGCRACARPRCPGRPGATPARLRPIRCWRRSAGSPSSAPPVRTRARRALRPRCISGAARGSHSA